MQRSALHAGAHRLALLALMFFVFLQLLTTLVEATYTFGLLSVDIPPETASVLFLLTPLLLAAFPRLLVGRAGRGLTLAAGLLALLCCAAALAAPPAGRMIFSGLGCGLFLLAAPGLLALAGRPDDGAASRLLGGGLGAAALLTAAAKALELAGLLPDSTPYRLAAWALALLAGILLVIGLRGGEPVTPGDPAPGGSALRFPQAALLWLGIFSALILVYFGLSAPGVIARWTGAGYLWVSVLLVLPPALFLAGWLGLPDAGRLARAPRVLLAWNALFVLALAVALLSHQVSFPADPPAYPLSEPPAGPLAGVALAVMLLLHPVVYLDFGLFAGQIARAQAAPRRIAGGLALAAVFLMLMIFAQVFTTVYDYIPVVGPPFRDRFWLVMTVPGAGLLLGLAGLRGRFAQPAAESAPTRRLAPAFLALGALALISAALSAPQTPPPAPAAQKTTLRVMTYNIQQGYDDQGRKNFAGQLDVIRREDPDIIGLQESDMARIANGNTDIVRYFANQLGMYSYYGPSTVTGTFGIALLSRYPIENPRTFFMYSEGEQTAAIQAEITAGGRTFHVLVTHLGNGGPLIQQEQVLARLEGQSNVVAMGDFNFRPSSEQYRVTTAALANAWEVAAQKSAYPGQDLDRRIDHIFLSPGMRVLDARYLPEGPSDHPALVVDLSLE